MNNTRKKLFALLAAGTLLCTGALKAITQDNLQNLVNTNGSLQIGDKTFSGFSYLDSGLTGFNANNIQVTASYVGGVYYLTWGGNITLVAGGAASADLLLNYTVSASAGLIDWIDQSYTGSAQPAGAAFLAVDETVFDPLSNTTVAFSHLQVGDLSDPFTEVGDDLDTSPGYALLHVTKDINFGVVNGGLVTISEVRQSFHQISRVPDGGLTVILLGIALSGIGLIRRAKVLR